MARIASNVAATSVTGGTGNLTLSPKTGKRAFSAEYAINERFPYQIIETDTAWEEGVGYLSASNTFVRETILRSSNSDLAVNFGTSNVTISPDFVSQMQHGFVTKITSVTTANITAQPGAHHELTVSGLTADRNFVLPGSAVVGSEIRVKLVTDAPDDYELILIGDTGVSINGGTAAAEWSRLMIDNECVTFRATSANNWDVVYDGRIPCLGKIKKTTVQSVAGEATAIQCNVSEYARGVINDVVTTHSIKVRRTGRYNVIAFGSLDNLGSTIIATAGIRKNAETDSTAHPNGYSPGTSAGPTFSVAFTEQFDQGDLIRLSIWCTTTRNTRATGEYVYPFVEIEEAL